MLCSNLAERTALITFLKEQGVHAVFHYICLHTSPFYSEHYNGEGLPNAMKYDETLVRLPMFYELTDDEVDHIVNSIKLFYSKNSF